MCGVNPVGDLVPRRGHDLLRGFSAGVGQLEQLLAALAFRGDNQPLVDQQLQGRVDRAGARLPQVLAPLGDLLDDFVAVHRSLGEQHQDGGTNVTTAAAPAVAAASSTASGRAEAGTEAAGAEAAGTEAASETAAEAGPERPVMTGVVVADQAAELTASLPALLVQCAAVQGCESEARRPRPTRERPAHMGKWVVHGVVLVSGKVAPDALPIRRRYIGSYRYARSVFEPALSTAVCGRYRRGSTSPMSQENVHVTADAGSDRDALAEPGDTDRDKRVRLWVNWALALLTVVGAGVVMLFALGAVMSTAACSDKACPNLGPNGISFNALYYGAPVVAALVVVASFFTARRRWGFVIPVVALALLIGDVAILATTVVQ